MNAKDVMTHDVVTVGPDDTVATVAETLLKHGISAVPVVDDTKLVGLISEGDLIRRTEIGTEQRHRSWWLRLFGDSASLASEYVKSHSRIVRDVMTKEVITVREDTSLAEIATVLESNRIKRVPVIRDGRLIGIVSRANLVQSLAVARKSPLQAAAPDDSRIREQVLEALRSQPWSDIGTTTNVTVSDGLVEFWGVYRSESTRDAERVAAEEVPGVTAVQDHRQLMASPYGYV